MSIPVINITNLSNAGTRELIDSACREWGFFQVIGHGVDNELVSTLHQQMRLFFGQSIEAKRAIVRTAENPWGFYDRELTRNTADWKQVYDYGPPDGNAIKPQWPPALAEFPAAIRAFYAECDALSLDLLRVISTNLGMSARSLDSCFRPTHTSFLRLNYYPKCPTTGHLGVNHHTDAGALTVLLQDEQPGLEVLHRGEWVLIEPLRDALVINIGDIVQVWSNDQYKAVSHRVLASGQAERFSAPFFFNPAYSTEYAPLPSTIDLRCAPRYRPINWGEFRARRAAGDYADTGAYHQISYYSR